MRPDALEIDARQLLVKKEREREREREREKEKEKEKREREREREKSGQREAACGLQRKEERRALSPGLGGQHNHPLSAGPRSLSQYLISTSFIRSHKLILSHREEFL